MRAESPGPNAASVLFADPFAHEDARILFILTTNRSGRRTAFPCRRQPLYAAKLCLAGETVSEVAQRAKGCTASTIREPVRGAAQIRFEADGEADIPPEVFTRALEEMTLRGGKLNARLLGASPKRRVHKNRVAGRTNPTPEALRRMSLALWALTGN